MAVLTRITCADGEPMGIAGLWSWWRSPAGEVLYSYTMLTINASEHGLMQNFHKPAYKKRMVVILLESAYDEWLTAPLNRVGEFLVPYSADAMVAEAPRRP